MPLSAGTAHNCMLDNAVPSAVCTAVPGHPALPLALCQQQLAAAAADKMQAESMLVQAKKVREREEVPQYLVRSSLVWNTLGVGLVGGVWVSE